MSRRACLPPNKTTARLRRPRQPPSPGSLISGLKPHAAFQAQVVAVAGQSVAESPVTAPGILWPWRRHLGGGLVARTQRMAPATVDSGLQRGGRLGPALRQELPLGEPAERTFQTSGEGGGWRTFRRPFPSRTVKRPSRRACSRSSRATGEENVDRRRGEKSEKNVGQGAPDTEPKGERRDEHGAEHGNV